MPTMLPRKWEISSTGKGREVLSQARRECTPGVAPENNRTAPPMNVVIANTDGIILEVWRAKKLGEAQEFLSHAKKFLDCKDGRGYAERKEIINPSIGEE